MREESRKREWHTGGGCLTCGETRHGAPAAAALEAVLYVVRTGLEPIQDLARVLVYRAQQ